MHFDFRADVDAARRFVDDEDFRPQREPARQNDLLLISAGKIARGLIGAGHANAEAPAELVDEFVLLALVDEPPRTADLAVGGDRHVGADREAQEQRLRLAVLGHEADAVCHRIAWAIDGDGNPVDPDCAVIELVGAEDRARGLCASRADEPCEPQNLPLLRAQRNIDEFDGVRIAGAAPARKAFDLERDRSVRRDRPRPIQRVDIASDHHADDRPDIRAGDATGADVMAVAQHRVAVAKPENLLQPVGDEDDRQAFALELPDDAGEIGDLGLAQGRGRLVHDDKARAHRERAGDLDELLLRDREIAHRRHRIALEADPVGDRLRVRCEARAS